MTVSANTSNFTRVINTSTATSHSLALPTAVPVGATIVAGIYNRTDNSAPTGCSDGSNGAYTLGSERGGGTNNAQLYYFLNNGSNAAHTVTFTYSSPVAAQLWVGWIQSDAGTLAFDAAATVATVSLGTTATSNNATATGAGAIVGHLILNNAQTDPEPSVVAPEYEMLGGLSGLRMGAFFEAYATAGNYGFTATIDNASGAFLVIALKEPDAAPSITSVSPSTFAAGASVTITGTNFGASQGVGGVYISDIDDINDASSTAQTVTAWSNTEITFTAVRGSLTLVASEYLFVEASGGQSNADGYVVSLTGTKKLKLLVHSSAASASGVNGVVFAAPTGGAIAGSEIGEFTNKTFEASLESDQAVLKVPVADFGGTSLTTSDTPVVLVRNDTYTTGIISATVIEE